MDNKLEIGDACVFELLDYSTQVLKFRVQILRGKIPSEFLDYSKNGLSKDTPIIINWGHLLNGWVFTCLILLSWNCGLDTL